MPFSLFSTLECDCYSYSINLMLGIDLVSQTSAFKSDMLRCKHWNVEVSAMSENDSDSKWERNLLRRSVVEQPQPGVDQSDALLITGVNHNLIGSRAGRSCNVFYTALQRTKVDADGLTA